MKSFSIWRKTISGRLTIIFAVMFILVLLAVLTASFLGIRFFLINNAKKSLESSMEVVLNRLSSGDGFSQDLEELGTQNLHYRVLTTNKSIIVQSRQLSGLELPLEKGYVQIGVNNKYYLYRSVFLLNRGEFVGYLQAVKDITLEYRFIKTIFLVLSLASLIGIIGAIIAGYTVTRKTLEPITALTNTARNISVFDLGQRLEITGPEDELTNLARTFNSMLDRLEDAFKRQQQFVSDASHELRTPISVIQGYINLLHRWGKEDQAVSDEAITAIRKEIENMGVLVENLLFLARGDSDSLDINKHKFQLNELIEELVRETTMLAKDISVSNEFNTNIELLGDRKLIKQMLRVFIDNSIKYTPTGGEIRINALERGDFIELIVADTGIGIAEEDLPHIFERFYRADKARSDRKGTGLGLAIAKWIVENHEGKILVESSRENGTKISILLPKK